MKPNRIISDSSDNDTAENENREESKCAGTSEITNTVQKRKPAYMSDGSFKCLECDFHAKSSGKVYSHMADEHNMDNFTCDYCKFITKNKTSLHNHKKKYCRGRKKEKSEKKQVTNSSGKEQVKKPVSIKNADGGILFKCGYCDFRGGSGGVVYSHMNQQHGMEKFECTYCHFSTANKTSMYNHKTRYCRQLKM